MRCRLVLMSLLLILAAPSAVAEEVVCDHMLTGKISANVLVPQGGECVIDGAVVKGNVKVEPDGSLAVLDARIDGNVQTEGAASIQIVDGSHVRGNVQLRTTRGTPGVDLANTICRSEIDGDIQLKDNEAPFEIGCEPGNKVSGSIQIQNTWIPSDFLDLGLTIRNNDVGGDIQVKENESAAGPIDITANALRGNLQCEYNSPAPIGGENVVGGNAEGQCSTLAIRNGNHGNDKWGDLDGCDDTLLRHKVGGVTVKSGQVCVLLGTKVFGNIHVEPGGALEAQGAKVRGNIQADGAAWVVIGPRTKVRGNVQIDGSVGSPDGDTPNQVCGVKIRGNLQITRSEAPIDVGCDVGNKVKGNVQIEDNRVPAGFAGDGLRAVRNKVAGDLQLVGNDNGSGTTDVTSNRIKGNLQCSDNSPAPTGGDNKVKGNADDQCTGLAD